MDASTRINADFDRAVVDRPEQAVWVGSPLRGVTRRMLDRVGGEVARATSLVRYAPHSRFAQHVHGGGEEILVLEGVFDDEYGSYPAGVYLRNPRGTRHAPHSESGCLLLVKLHQFAASDDTRLCLDTAVGKWIPAGVPNVMMQRLHVHGDEQVSLERWAPGSDCVRAVPEGGEELYLLEGSLGDALLGADAHYPAGTWLRSPPAPARRVHSAEGCLLYRKTGHLPI